MDRAWSRRLTAPDGEGIDRSWHVLDNGVEPTAGTMLCVHGNPTWSYLWRRFLGAAPPAGGWWPSTSWAWAGPSGSPHPGGWRPGSTTWTR